MVRANQSKLRKDHDDWPNVPIPLSEDVEDEPQYSLADTFWLATTKGQTDFQELFTSSSRLSSACADAGLRVGTPIDLRAGFDTATQVGQNSAWKHIMAQ